MGDKTHISWTDATWNPYTGIKGQWYCTKVSPGCEHCYAEQFNIRMGGPAYTVGADILGFGSDKKVYQPLHWRKPRMVFVNSMSDTFHDQAPDSWIDFIFAVMSQTPRHRYQVLTKRSKRMREYLSDPKTEGRVRVQCSQIVWDNRIPQIDFTWPLQNVMVMVSVENQEWADKRIPDLEVTPAAWRGVNLGPLLGPMDLGMIQDIPDRIKWTDRAAAIHWIALEGESGPGARPMDLKWAHKIVFDARRAGIPVYVKQLGGYPDKQTDIDKFPRYLRYRQVPDAFFLPDWGKA